MLHPYNEFHSKIRLVVCIFYFDALSLSEHRGPRSPELSLNEMDVAAPEAGPISYEDRLLLIEQQELENAQVSTCKP